MPREAEVSAGTRLIYAASDISGFPLEDIEGYVLVVCTKGDVNAVFSSTLDHSVVAEVLSDAALAMGKAPGPDVIIADYR